MRVLSFLLALSCVSIVVACRAGDTPSETEVKSDFRAEINAKTGKPFERMLRGVVVDASGQPLRAKVHLVTPTGSQSSTTSPDGHFQFFELRATSYSVTVTTKEGRIAVLPEVEVAPKPLQIPVVNQGSKLLLSVSGKSSMRWAISQGETWLFNFSAKEGKEAEVVVPEGEIGIRLYGGDYFEDRTIMSTPGQRTSVEYEYTD